MATTSAATKASTVPKAPSGAKASSITKKGAHSASASKGLRSTTQPALSGIEGFSLKPVKQSKTRYKNRPILQASAVAGNLAFLRVHKYSQVPLYVPPKKDGTEATGTQTIRDIIGEAGRLRPENCQHLIKNGLKPEPPRCLYGLPREKLDAWVDEHIEATQGAHILQKFPHRAFGTWKKQQPEAQTMLAVVMACPYPPSEDDERYTKWRGLCVAWALKKYGAENVVTILEHTDEGRWVWQKDALGDWEKVWQKTGHIHVAIARKDGSSIADLHDMRTEVQAAMARGESSNELGQFYRQGGRALQDQFHEAVGEPMGWRRDAEVKYQRYGYTEAKVRKQLVDEVHQANVGIQADRDDQVALKAAIDHDAEQLKKQREQLEAEEQDRRKRWLLEANEGDLNIMQLGMRRALLKQQAKDKELAEREEQMKRERQELDQLREAKAVARRRLDRETFEAIFGAEDGGQLNAHDEANRPPEIIGAKHEHVPDAPASPGLPSRK